MPIFMDCAASPANVEMPNLIANNNDINNIRINMPGVNTENFKTCLNLSVCFPEYFNMVSEEPIIIERKKAFIRRNIKELTANNI